MLKCLFSVKKTFQGVFEKIEYLFANLFLFSCSYCSRPLQKKSVFCEACQNRLHFAFPDLKRPIVTFKEPSLIDQMMKHLKKGSSPKFAPLIGGYMALQYLQLECDLPDYIIPVPQALSRKIQVGYNPPHLMALQIGALFKKPVLSLLKCKPYRNQQMEQEKKARYQMNEKDFNWKDICDLKGKNLLLIDDVRGTGRTLDCCLKLLQQSNPFQVIGMAALQERLDYKD